MLTIKKKKKKALLEFILRKNQLAKLDKKKKAKMIVYK